MNLDALVHTHICVLIAGRGAYSHFCLNTNHAFEQLSQVHTHICVWSRIMNLEAPVHTRIYGYAMCVETKETNDAYLGTGAHSYLCGHESSISRHWSILAVCLPTCVRKRIMNLDAPTQTQFKILSANSPLCVWTRIKHF